MHYSTAPTRRENQLPLHCSPFIWQGSGMLRAFHLTTQAYGPPIWQISDPPQQRSFRGCSETPPQLPCPSKEQVLLRNLKTGPAVLKNSRKHVPLLMLCKLSCTKVTESSPNLWVGSLALLRTTTVEKVRHRRWVPSHCWSLGKANIAFFQSNTMPHPPLFIHSSKVSSVGIFCNNRKQNLPRGTFLQKLFSY